VIMFAHQRVQQVASSEDPFGDVSFIRSKSVVYLISRSGDTYFLFGNKVLFIVRGRTICVQGSRKGGEFRGR
jgi:hypothetical protein